MGQPIAICPPWAVVSPILAAGFPPIITVAEPFTIESGGPTQTQESPITAAGILPINTVGTPGPITGPPTCGIGGTPGVTIGQTCRSVILAAKGIFHKYNDFNFIKESSLSIWLKLEIKKRKSLKLGQHILKYQLIINILTLGTEMVLFLAQQ